VKKNFNILALILLPTFIYVLSGCGAKTATPKDSKAIFVVWKTPNIKFADQGFLNQEDGYEKFEVYSSAQPVISLKIYPDKICTSLLSCMSKDEFNSKYLNSAYPNDTLENILNAKEIFNGKNRKDIADGFEQKISFKDKYDINYKVSSNSVEFIDTKNKIMIKIRKN